MLALINANLILDDRILNDAVLLIENDRIVDFGTDVTVPAGAEVLDCKGKFVGPGLIDIHTHSDGTRWFYEQPDEAFDFVLSHGVTSVLPALYYNLNKQQFIDAINVINDSRARGKAPNFAGYYMEGPYLNPKFGCDREKNTWKGEIKKEDYDEIASLVGEDALVWCIAPEREGIEDFVKDICSRQKNPVFSVAHSEADPYQIEKLIPYGLNLATHHTNATGTLVKYPECRGVCVDEAVWFNDNIYAELICDSRGIHVDPYMIKLVLKIKGRDKVILISDAFVCDGPIPPGYDGVFDINFDNEGEIAGSKLTLDIACRNMLNHTGCSLSDVFAFASKNPAQLLGLSDLGEIKQGNIANLVVCDDKVNIEKTILKGRIVK